MCVRVCLCESARWCNQADDLFTGLLEQKSNALAPGGAVKQRTTPGVAVIKQSFQVF